MTAESRSGPVTPDGRTGRLIGGLTDVAAAAGERLVSAAGGRMVAATERLADYAANKGSPGLAAAATGARQAAAGGAPASVALRAGVAGLAAKARQALGRGGQSEKDKIKVTSIVESIDIGVPVRLAYDQWTRFGDWSTFMKKVESVEQNGDEKLTWKAQVFWSHRSWDSTIVEQVPDRRIVWRSEGAKGSVDGAVTFHELAPELTRIMVVLEYHPQGLFERTGNIWRAQGRRARLELKNFARHMMTQSVLRADDVEGWRGEIHDGRVVNDNDDDNRRAERARPADRAERTERAEPAGARPRREPRRDARAGEDRGERAAPPVRRRPAPRDDRRERAATRGRASNGGDER